MKNQGVTTMKARIAISIMGCMAITAHGAVIATGGGIATAAANPSTAWQGNYQGQPNDTFWLGPWATSFNTSYVSGGEVAITGTMTLSTPVNGDNWANLAIVELSTKNWTTWGTWNTALAGVKIGVAAASSDPGAPLKTAINTAGFVDHTLGVSNLSSTVGFAINLTLGDVDNTVAGSWTHQFELGVDVNNDGSYDFIQSGSYTDTDTSSIVMSFGAQQGAGDLADNLSNTYSFATHDQHVVIPEPTTLGLMGTIGFGLLAVRRMFS